MCCGAAPSYLPRFRPGGRESDEAPVTVVRQQPVRQASGDHPLGRLLLRSFLARHAAAVLRQGLGRGLFAARALMSHVRDVERLIGDSAEALFGFRGEVEVSHFVPRWLLASAAIALASAGV